jgi:hypothetical protein
MDNSNPVHNIKKLLQIPIFKPHFPATIMEPFYRFKTDVTLDSSELNDRFLDDLVKQFSLSFISECNFIGGKDNSIFFLSKFFKSHHPLDSFINETRHYYSVGYIPVNADKGYSKDDLIDFILFLKTGSAKYK